MGEVAVECAAVLVAQRTDAAWKRCVGEIAPAVSTGVFSGSEIGFEFQSNRASTSPGGYAQLGTVRNGVFL